MPGRFIISSIAFALALAALPKQGLAAQKIEFNRDIRPILSDKCFQCHGPEAKHRKAHLRLDTQEGAQVDLDGHRAVVPGRPDSSELVRRINDPDPDERMPPPESRKTLSSQEIALLTRWIETGAEWSEPWAYRRATWHPIPTTRDRAWALNWVDEFILARLEREGLSPSADADRVTLARRLFFDLIGLPPSPAEVESFVEDTRPGAYERLVDRLLASPAFGERMAVYWLDLVRYADTVGYHGDQDQNISPYRDYVIDALNRDLPFDQFTREQLAGDLIAGAGLEQTIATGYNRLLQTSHEGGVQAKEYLAIYAADRVRNLSEVWMGATLGCAQCHDHKYDPYSTKDFYSMQGFFADIDEARHLHGGGGDTIPTKREPELPLYTPEERAAVEVLTVKVVELKRDLEGCAPSEAADLKKRLKTTQGELDRVNKGALWTLITVAIKPRPIRVLPRGNWQDDSGPIVEPAVPLFLGKLSTNGRATRLDLANWLTNPKEGVGTLTARVMVNRFWYLTFGAGLARVLDDFGGQGEPPTHPDLLDNLAVEFVRSGWDIKPMMRLLVTSRAYQQSSLASDSLRDRDPDNRLIARQSTMRLPAEMVRDNALAVSGLLVERLGGRSVKPYQPVGYYRHLNFPKRSYHAETGADEWRRGLYMHWQRQFLHPMLKAFDAPSREECTAQRPRSNTPLAALTLLNDPTFVEAGRVFAANILREGGATSNSRLSYAFRRALSREPDAWEREHMLQLIDETQQHFADAPEAAQALVTVGVAPDPEGLDPIELASWTTAARALLNLNETITRN